MLLTIVYCVISRVMSGDPCRASAVSVIEFLNMREFRNTLKYSCLPLPLAGTEVSRTDAPGDTVTSEQPRRRQSSGRALFLSALFHLSNSPKSY